MLRKTQLAALTLCLSAPAAQATEAEATVNLNVRTGPGTSFSVVDTLDPGEKVEVVECQPNAWCYIDQAGKNGWVSSNYLRAVAPPPAPGGGGRDCQLQFTLGADGPKLAVVCDDPAPAPAPDPDPATDPDPTPATEPACFYPHSAYGGTPWCLGRGTRNAIEAPFDNNISSLRMGDAPRVRLCTDQSQGGHCVFITEDTPQLGPLINNRASSLTVFSPWWVGGSDPTPDPDPVPPTPATHSTGPLNVPQTWRFDLDNGTLGANDADFWYEAVNAAVRRLTPMNGAQLARGDGSNRGFAGCYQEAFSTTPLPFASLTPGTYVCAKTSQGRISQFRVNSYDGTTIRIGYTTWSD